MNLVDALGWSAASLMVATFSCRDPRWMRVLAVFTNVAFIGYAAHAHLAPVLALHTLLLPINLSRGWQAARERRHSRWAARSTPGERLAEGVARALPAATDNRPRNGARP